MNAEVIVIGSGASAVHCAQTLIENGHSVLMLDVGVTNNSEKKYDSEFSSFSRLRETASDQHDLLVGHNAQALNWEKMRAGAQLTPPRKYMLDRADELLKRSVDGFTPIESLAQGGLGVGWGAGSYVFSQAELSKAGLGTHNMSISYQKVIERIGVSQPGENVSKLILGECKPTEDKIKIEEKFNSILSRYQKSKQDFLANNLYMGEPALALLSHERGGRKKHKYRELDFYSDHEHSVYRPWMTLHELKQKSHFQYISGQLCIRFKEGTDRVSVEGIHIDTQEKNIFTARYLVICAGALGTARMALRSVTHKTSLRYLCNKYLYYPTLNISSLLRANDLNRLALSQMQLMYYNPQNPGYIATASMYSYRSLMLFRLIKESPLNTRSSRALFQLLQNALVIYGLHFPDEHDGSHRELKLIEDNVSLTKDRLRMTYRGGLKQPTNENEIEKKFLWAMRKLGTLPIKRLQPEYGASIHYAGTLPYSDSEAEFTLHASGRLARHHRVYVGDGSGLNFLPAKGLTLTLMAIGDSVGQNVSRNLKCKE